MTLKSESDVISRLDSLLELEREALLNGDLEKISEQLEEKEELLDRLSEFEVTPKDDLQELQIKVERNQLLLDGALQGIRKVAARMAAFRRIRRSLDTYDQTGRRTTIQGDVERQVEKRA